MRIFKQLKNYYLFSMAGWVFTGAIYLWFGIKIIKQHSTDNWVDFSGCLSLVFVVFCSSSCYSNYKGWKSIKK